MFYNLLYTTYYLVPKFLWAFLLPLMQKSRKSQPSGFHHFHLITVAAVTSRNRNVLLPGSRLFASAVCIPVAVVSFPRTVTIFVTYLLEASFCHAITAVLYISFRHASTFNISFHAATVCISLSRAPSIYRERAVIFPFAPAAAISVTFSDTDSFVFYTSAFAGRGTAGTTTSAFSRATATAKQQQYN